MKQIDVAKAASVSRVHLNTILSGKRTASPKLATRLEKITGIAREIWVFGTPEERRAAWNKAKAKEART